MHGEELYELPPPASRAVWCDCEKRRRKRRRRMLIEELRTWSIFPTMCGTQQKTSAATNSLPLAGSSSGDTDVGR